MTRLDLSRRELLQTAALAGGGLGLAACGSGSGSGSGGQLKLWHTFSTSSNIDKREDFWIIKSVRRFEKDSGMDVEVTDLLGGLEQFTKFRAAGVARNGPDVATLWSGAYAFGVKDYLEPLDDYLSADFRESLTGWAAGTEGFVPGEGTIYGVPTGGSGITAVYYDKQALDRASVVLDEEEVLEWDAWLDLLEQIKSTGVMPLAMAEFEYTAFSLFYWIAQVVGGESGVHALGSGEQDFSDPAIEDVITKWLQLVDYTVPTPATMENAVNQVTAGKAAAVIKTAGSITALREALGDNVVINRLPNISPNVSVRDTGIGGPGGVHVVTNYSQRKENAVALIEHLASKEEQQRRVANGELTPIPNAVGLDPTAIYDDPLFERVYRWENEKFVFWVDNIWPTELVDEILAQAQLAWAGEIDAAEFLGRVDAKRDEILAKE